MRILVTGCNGFIGSHIVDFYLKKNYEVFGCGHSETRIENKCRYYNVEMKNINLMEKILDEAQPEIVFHCAGSTNYAKSKERPFEDYEGNVTILHNLLFAMNKVGLQNTTFIFLSTASVYGNPNVLPVREIDELHPLIPYSLHKSISESICKYFFENHGFNIKIARIFSAYGEGLKKQIFWDMHRRYMDTGKLEMYGTGQESRDYIHIDDLVQALDLIAFKSSKDELFFNIANGQEIKIKTVVNLFARAANIDEKYISFSGKGKEGNPINWKADISKIKSLGYRQTVSFEDGIKRYVKWVGEQKDEIGLFIP